MALRTAVTLGNKQFLKSIDQMERRMGGFNAFMHRNSLKFAAGAGIIAAGLGLAVKAAADFEQSMANMDSVANTTGEEFERLRQLAFNMSETTTRSATESATAMYELASAGQSAQQIFSTLPSVIKLADATQFDLSQTTSTVVSTLKAFGMEASQTERLVNVMAATIGGSLAKMDKLSASFAYIGPVAASAGMSIEATSAALAVLYDAGLDGSAAGTTLRRILASLLDPSDSLRARIDKLNLSMSAVDPRMHSLSEIMEVLKEAGIDATAAFQDFGLRGAPGLLALLQAGKGIDEFERGITGTDRATQMLARQMETLQAQAKILKNQFVTLGIKIGEKLLPFTKELVQWLKTGAAKLDGMSDSAFELTAKIGLLAGGTFAFLAVVGRMAPILGAATGPLALLGIAAAALAAAYILASQNMEEYYDALRDGNIEEARAMQRIAERSAMIKAAFDPAYWEAVGGDLMNFLIRMGAAFGAFFSDVGEEAVMLGRAFDPRNWIKPGFWDEFTAEFSDSVGNAMQEAWASAPVDLPEGAESWTQAYYDNLFTPPADVAEKAATALTKTLNDVFEIVEIDGARLRGKSAEVMAFFQSAMREGLDPEETQKLWAETFGTAAPFANIVANGVEARFKRMTETIRDEMEFAGAALTGFMTTVGDQMGEALVGEKKLAKELVKAVGKSFVDLVDMYATKAVTTTLMAQAETAGILSMEGLFNPAAWAKLAPALAKGAATIALIKAIKGKLGFHSGGAPFDEGFKWVKNDELIIDRGTAQRGGYGRATLDAGDQDIGGGMRVTVTMQIANANMSNLDEARAYGRALGEEVEFALDAGA
jgi:TP901 family phage tail tape measure protein